MIDNKEEVGVEPKGSGEDQEPTDVDNAEGDEEPNTAIAGTIFYSAKDAISALGDIKLGKLDEGALKNYLMDVYYLIDVYANNEVEPDDKTKYDETITNLDLDIKKDQIRKISKMSDKDKQNFIGALEFLESEGFKPSESGTGEGDSAPEAQEGQTKYDKTADESQKKYTDRDMFEMIERLEDAGDDDDDDEAGCLAMILTATLSTTDPSNVPSDFKEEALDFANEISDDELKKDFIEFIFSDLEYSISEYNKN